VRAHEGPEVSPPHFAAVEVQRQQDDLLGRRPRDDHAVGVHGRSRGGVAVGAVLPVGLRGIVAPPERAAVGRGEAEHGAPGRFRVGARQEDPLAPDHRRRVADAGQLDLPVVVLIGPRNGDGGRVADPAAARASKTGPILVVFGKRNLMRKK